MKISYTIKSIFGCFMNNNIQRIYKYDNLKGIEIILIVLGHII